ncbi:hypothetical protein BCT69_24235 [Enterovibrio norvegicus]|nr:hypothetical protein BCT69_24235 [Enterovibrio norvegicus]
MKTKHWKLIRKLSIAYIAIVAILFLSEIFVFTFVDYGHKPTNFVGCYAYDAMLVGFKCVGLPAAEWFSFALNFPLYHLYMPFFILWRPVLILLAVAMYAPYFLVFISHHKVVSARV